VTVDTKFAPFVVIKGDDGRQVDLKPADDLAATMMVKAYVPEYDPDIPGAMTFDEAFSLALQRDAQAADDLAMSAEQCDVVPDIDVDLAMLAKINAAFEAASRAEAAEMPVVKGL